MSFGPQEWIVLVVSIITLTAWFIGMGMIEAEKERQALKSLEEEGKLEEE